MWWLRKRTPIVSRWWFILLLMGAVAMMFSAVMGGQGKTTIIFLGHVDSMTAASTTCSTDSVPVIAVFKYQNKRDLALILIHEFTHVEQMKRHVGGCLGFQKEYDSSLDFRFKSEAEAYCMETSAALFDGTPPRFTPAELIRNVRPFVPSWSDEKIWANLPCGGSIHVPP